jgi:hypothetical protein
VRQESPDDSIAANARRLVENLNEAEGSTAETMEPEPLFEVEDIRDEPKANATRRSPPSPKVREDSSSACSARKTLPAGNGRGG